MESLCEPADDPLSEPDAAGPVVSVAGEVVAVVSDGLEPEEMSDDVASSAGEPRSSVTVLTAGASTEAAA
ncbi:hypothetical protein G3I15_01990, partial [Streptomyces sp. SID10244]|nr:hypothetical protein [Streptomyces sp. SID10244]